MAESTAQQVAIEKPAASTNDKNIPWPDFSNALFKDLEIKMFMLSRGRRYLILQNGENYPFQAKEMGFVRSASGVWVRPEGQITSQMFRQWQQVIPNIGIKKVAPEDVVIGDSLQKTAVQDLLSKSDALGYNRLGQLVYRLHENDRRFTKNPRGWKIAWEPENYQEEDGNRDLQPDIFLRAMEGDYASLLRCAEGALFSLSSGHIESVDDIGKLASIAQVSQSDLAGAIADAITRSYTATRGIARDAFDVARDLEERVVFQTGALPAPLQVALSRLLGNEMELRNAKVTFSADIADLGIALRIPRTAELSALTANDAEAQRAGAMARGNHSAIRLETHDDRVAFHNGSDVVIHKMSSLDLDEVEALHDYRAADGRTVLIIDADPEPTQDEVEKFLREIGRGLHVENSAIVSGSYITKNIGGRSQVVVSIGPRRTAPLSVNEVIIPEKLELLDNADAWRFGMDTLHSRRISEEATRIANGSARSTDDASRENLDPDADVSQGTLSDDGTDYQVPYISACRELGEPEALLPRHLDGASRKALEHLVRRRGNIVEFLCDQLHWTKDQLAENLSPEQADAVALWIDARLTRDPSENSVIFADGTGTGKGRELATTMIWSALRGEVSIFLTENVKLLNDIWNDIREMKMTHLFNPLVTNQTKNSVIVDLNTHEPLFPPVDSATLEAMYESGRIPDGVNLVMGSFTQLNKTPQSSNRVSWFRKVVRETHLVTDESHVAAGNGITSRNVQAMIRDAQHHTPGSGTWSKDIRAIPFYHRAIPNSLPINQLVPIFRKGGITAQEAFTSMMVSSGRMVRREMSLSKVEFSTVADAEIGLSTSTDSKLTIGASSADRAVRNRAIAADVSASLAEIAKFAGLVRKHIQQRDAELAADQRRRVRNRNQTNDGDIQAIKGTSASIGSPLHQFSRVFEAALIADLAVEEGLKAIEADEKPVFVTDLTGENYMSQILEDGENRIPTIKDALNRIILMSCKYRRMGQTRIAIEENEDLHDEYERVKAVIATLPDFPILATDVIKGELRKRNISFSEISGRKHEVIESNIVPRNDTDPSETIHDFQSGDLDSLFLGKPGFTGISLHSSEKAKDQRKRNMLMVLPPQDILQLFQVFGRVVRRKQVTGASITWLSSGLPASLKLAMYTERHMQRLSANTTSNRENAVSRGDLIPDIFNSVGHEVCFRFLESNPILAERMGLADMVREAIEDDESLGSLDGTWANKMMTYMHLLHPDEQDRVMAEIFEEYEQVIEELDGRNENPLRTKALLGTCKVINKEVFDGVEGGTGDREPVYLVEVEHTQDLDPMRSEEVLALVDNAEAEVSRAQMSDDPIFKGASRRSCVRNPSEVANMIRSRELDFLTEALERHNAKSADSQFDSVESALRNFTQNGTNKNRVRKTADLIEDLTNTLPKLRPGASIINYRADRLDSAEGIITDIVCPTPGNEMKLGHYRLSVVWPGEEKPQNISLSFILSSSEVFIGEGIHGRQADKIIKSFDADDAGQVTKSRHFLMGNILEALRISTSMEKPLGQISTFTDENGVVHRGLLIKEAAQALDLLPVSIAEAAVAAEVISRPGGTDLYSTSQLKPSKGVVIRRGANGADQRPETFLVRYPTTKGADSDIYESDAINRRIANIGTKRGRPTLEVTAYELPTILKELTDAGVTFYAPPSVRQMTNEIATDRAEANRASSNEHLHQVVVNLDNREISNRIPEDNTQSNDNVGFDDDAINMLMG